MVFRSLCFFAPLEVPHRPTDIDHAGDAASDVTREDIVQMRLDPGDLVFVRPHAVEIGAIATRSILLPSITTVAFGSTLPSAGLITVAPTSEVFSPRAVSVKIANAKPNKRIFVFINTGNYELGA